MGQESENTIEVTFSCMNNPDPDNLNGDNLPKSLPQNVCDHE